jgi:hypothetical protein
MPWQQVLLFAARRSCLLFPLLRVPLNKAMVNRVSSTGEACLSSGLEIAEDQAYNVTSCLNAACVIASSKTDMRNPDEPLLCWIASPGK